MKERFVLAAQVLLTRRLKNLLRVDEGVEIDMSYITCAEYQLFIDAQQVEKRQVQPDHWMTDRFAPGTARHPITGVRAKDAEAFCDWLTQQQFTPGFRYRLPKPLEAMDHNTVERDIGCWCQTDNNYMIAGIEPDQWRQWQEQLQKQIEQNIHLYGEAGSFFLEPAYDRDRIQDLANEPALKHVIDLVITLVFDLALTRARALARALARARARDLDRDLTRTRNLDLAHDLAHDLARTRDLAHDLDRALDRARNLDLAHDLAHDLARARDIALDLVRALARARALARDLARDRTRAFANDLALALALARALALDLDVALARDFDHDLARGLARALDLDLDLARDRARALDLDLDLTRARALDCTVINDYDRTQSLNIFQNYLLGVCQCLDFLISVYHRAVEKRSLLRRFNRVQKRDDTKIQKYIDFRNRAGQLYCHFALIELRREGKMPAWEGIRIVRERIEL